MKKRYHSILQEIKEAPPAKTERDDHILLVDGLNNFIRCFAAIAVTNDDGIHVGAIIGFLKSLAYSIKLVRPTRVIIIFDGKGGSQKRKKMFSGYKEGRAFRSNLNRRMKFDDPADEQKNMSMQMSRVMDYLNSLPVQTHVAHQVEADDIIAYCAKQALPKSKVTIMSTDKDFLQLVNDRISVYSPTKKKMYTPASLSEEYEGIKPENFIMYRMIDGDKSDNIDGVKGFGLKTLLKVCPDLADRPMSLKEVVDSDKRLSDDLEKLKRNFELMQLSDVVISGNTKSSVLTMLQEDSNSLNKLNLQSMFLEDRMSGAIPNFDVWLRETWTTLNYHGKKS